MLRECVVVMRYVALEVGIPPECLGDLIMGFGQEFALKDTVEGFSPIMPVDRYTQVNNGCVRVRFSVPHEDESRLREFLRRFSEEHDIGFKESE